MTTVASPSDPRVDDVIQVLESHGKALKVLDEKVDRIDEKVDRIDEKVDRIEEKLDLLIAKTT